MTTPRSGVSVIVITRNEERNIEACLRSVTWSDDIIVVDGGSCDRTVELARRFTPNVFVTEWLGFAGAKSLAMRKAKHDWIFWLDADERVPEDLADEIAAVLSGDPPASAYQVARRAYFLGRWIRHCGWYPSYVVRLFRRSKASFDDSRVHEALLVSGEIGRLRHDLLHFTDETLYHYLWKFNSYTSLAAEDLADRGRSFSLTDVLVRPPYLFLKMYVLRLGFLDGVHGLVLSLLSGAYVFCKYAKVWDQRRIANSRPAGVAPGSG